MRRILTMVILILVIVLALGTSAGLALVTLAPIHPGDSLYLSLQKPLEQALVLVTPGQTGKVKRLLDISQHRARDLALLAGTTQEAQALAELEQSLTQAVSAMSVASQADAPTLHPRLRTLLLTIEKVIPQLQPPADWAPGKWAAFLAWEQQVSQKTMRSTLVLADLSSQGSAMAQSQPGAPNVVPTAAITPTPAIVADRMVWFQTGSPGQLHSFYPLTGAHAALDCKSCHPAGAYAGTQATCEGCHQAPANHFPEPCTTCHTTVAWKPAFFDHTLSMAANCLLCHSGDKPAGHYPGMCSACHNTNAWKPAHFNHQVAGATDCQSCHAGDKPANHYNGQCSACHSTNAWLPASFNHKVAGATNCVSCHSKDAPAGHFSGQCSACHSTSAWLPASFNHAAAGATNCVACHAKDKPAGHYNGQCSACHSTNAWKPAGFNHAVAGATDCQACHARPAGHYDGQCSMCHGTDTWAGATFNHTFPTGHGGANGQCSTCHPGGTGSWTCTACHSEADMNAKHQGVSGYSGNCIACHPTGNKPGD